MKFLGPYLGQNITTKERSEKGNWTSFNIKLKTNIKGTNTSTATMVKTSTDMGEVVGSIHTKHYFGVLSLFLTLKTPKHN